MGLLMRAAIALAVLWSANAGATDVPPRCVQLIGTNDFHGHFNPEPRKADGKKVQQGGLSTFGGYVSILRKKYPGEVVLLDGGDLLHGTLSSNASEGASVVAAYRQLGYTAVAVGNHEFDFGARGREADRTGVLQARMAEASFPFLSSNIFDKKTGQRPTWKNFAASKLVQVNGLKLGIIGASTRATPITTEPLNVAGLDFKDAAPSLVEESKRLKSEGADFVILVAHIGGRCEDNSNPADVSSCDSHSELFELLDHLPASTLDAVIAGHSHADVAHVYRQVAVSEAGSYGREFGWISACREGATRTVNVHPLTPICVTQWKEGGCGPRASTTGTEAAKFLGEAVVPDRALEKTLEPYWNAVKAKSEELIGASMAQALERDRTRPTGLGMLVAEAVRRAVPGAQVGFINPGGLRADLPAGPIHFGPLYEVLPFDDHIVRLKITGEQLERLVLSVSQHGFGMSQLSGATVSGSKVLLGGGAPLNPAQEYVLATNDFLANGGDGTAETLAQIRSEQRFDTDMPVRDAVISYLRAAPQPVQSPILEAKAPPDAGH